MKKRIYLLLALFMMSAAGCEVKEKPVILIDDIQITKAEFEAAFQASRFAAMKDGREAFLDSYIEKKLILKKAEDMGLDKDPAFLNEIQSFWEKALLKSVLVRKSNELGGLAQISEKEIRTYYDKNREEFFPDKELAEVHDRISWLLLQQKQKRAMEEWVNTLRAKAKIAIDRSRLGL